jgi:hypothetical protein
LRRFAHGVTRGARRYCRTFSTVAVRRDAHEDGAYLVVVDVPRAVMRAGVHQVQEYD